MQSLGKTIHIPSDRTYVGHSRDLPPIASIKSGDTIELQLPNASGGQLTPQSVAHDVATLDRSKANPTLGPIAVEGARPGDTLQVDILEIVPDDWAFTVQAPGLGLLTDLFPDPFIHIWRYEDSKGIFADGIRIPLEPFPGVVCTGQADTTEDPATFVPQRVGGNMDMKHVRVGSSLYLPIELDDAQLSIGDPHCAQGDGEVCGSAIEGGFRIAVRVTLRKDLSIETPELDVRTPLERPSAAAAGYHVTMGVGPDLREAARQAVLRMIEYLMKTYGLTRQYAYMLCSVQGDLKISEIVDAPNWVVSIYIPRDIFPTAR
jgi:acetamidase/formamidase